MLAVGLLFLLIPCFGMSATNIELSWKDQLGSPVQFPPVITEQYVIATTASGEIFGYNRESGQLIWSTGKDIRFWDRSLVVQDDRLFVGRSGGILESRSISDGKLLWRVNLGIDVQVRPLVLEGKLYVPTTYVGTGLANDPYGKAILFVIDSNTGDTRWAYKTGNYALQTPSYYNDTLYLAGSYYDPSIEIDEGGPMRVIALSKDGEQVFWKYEAEDGFIKAVYADKNNVVYVGYQDFINALDSSNGHLRWRLDTGNWTPSLLGIDGVIYFGSATTWVFSVSSDKGEVQWKFNIGGGSFNYQMGKPVLSNGILYFLTQKGDIYALEAGSGKRLWFESTNIDARAGLSVEGHSLATGGIDGSLQVYRIQ